MNLTLFMACNTSGDSVLGKMFSESVKSINYSWNICYCLLLLLLLLTTTVGWAHVVAIVSDASGKIANTVPVQEMDKLAHIRVHRSSIMKR